MSAIQMIDGRYFVVEDSAAVADAASTGNVNTTTAASFDSVFQAKTGGLSLEDIFQKMAAKYDIPVDLLKAVAKVESDFNMDCVSSTGATGIMQLMPKTAESLGVTDIHDPEQNIEGGAKYLAGAIDYFGGDVALAVAAYNASYGAVERYGGIPPYEETQNYVRKIYNVLSQGTITDLSGIGVYEQGTYTPTEVPAVGTVMVSPKEEGNSSGAYSVNTRSADTASAVSNALQKLYEIVLGTDHNGRKMTLTEYISYENYMRLLDEFNEILQRVCFQDSDNDSDSSFMKNDKDSLMSNMLDSISATGAMGTAGTDKTDTYQSLYEATSSRYSARAQSLLNL